MLAVHVKEKIMRWGKRERDKETNEQKYQRLITVSCLHHHYSLSSLKKGREFKILCSCEWLWVQTPWVGLMGS